MNTTSIKNYLFLSLFSLLFFTVKSSANDLIFPIENQNINDFITSWQVEDNDIITIPLQIGTYNFNYTWTLLSNPSIQITGTHTNADGNFTTTFVDGGIYELEISGAFPHLKDYPVDKLLDVIQWGDIVWRNMFRMFMNWPGTSFTATDAPNLSQVTNMSFMFKDAINFNGEIGHWEVGNVTNMGRMFENASNFNQALGNWHVDNVTEMTAMFNAATQFDSDISNWNVGKVTNMNGMFRSATNFNQDIGNWTVNKVIDMEDMFRNATNFNQDISNWDVSSVTNMRQMFDNADSFNQPIGNWDVSNNLSFREMFRQNNAFNQSLGGWIFNPSANFLSVFGGASAFDCQSWSSTILGWNFSNPDLENISIGGPNAEYDAIADRARDELIRRGWSINGTFVGGDCGATHQFKCKDNVLVSNDTLFGHLVISASQVITLDNIVLDTQGVTTILAGESITFLPGFQVTLGADFTANIGIVDCPSTNPEVTNMEGFTTNESVNTKEILEEETIELESNIAAVAKASPTLMENISLQVSPNPFQTETLLSYHLPIEAPVTIELFDQMGGLVKTIMANERTTAGKYTVNLRNDQGLKGWYYVVFRTESDLVVQKVVIQ